MAETVRDKKVRRNMVEALIVFLACFVTFILTTFIAGRGPAKAADSFLNGVSSFKPSTVSSYYAGEVSDFDFSTMVFEAEAAAADGEDTGSDALTDEEKEKNIKFSTLLYDFTYEVGDAVKDGRTATVPVTIKTYPIGKTYASSENPREDIVALEKKGQTETWKITLTLTKANGEWTVDPLTDEAKNALSGGLYEVLNS